MSVSTPLVRLYSEYMHAEYAELDSDYVFVNLWGGRRGIPMSYPTVDKLVARIRARTGVEFTVHMLRHTHATDMVGTLLSTGFRRGVPIEVVAKLAAVGRADPAQLGAGDFTLVADAIRGQRRADGGPYSASHRNLLLYQFCQVI